MSDLSVALVRAGALIQRLQDHGLLGDRQWSITQLPGSPWINVDAEPLIYVLVQEPPPGARALGARGVSDPPAYRFAIWRETGELYAVGPDGSVGGEPIALGDFDERG